MSGKDLKLSKYLLEEKTPDNNKTNLDDLQTTEHLSKLKNKLKVCSFVEKCITKAQKKKIIDDYLKNFTEAKEYSLQSMFSKILATISL